MDEIDRIKRYNLKNTISNRNLIQRVFSLKSTREKIAVVL